MSKQQRLMLLSIFLGGLLGGLVLAVVLLGGGGSPTPSSAVGESSTPIAAVSASPAPSEVAPTDAATPAPTDAPSPAPTPAPTDAPTATPAPSATPAPTATPALALARIRITSLKTDAAVDPDGLDRLITFSTATGTITVELKNLSPMGSAKLCLTASGKNLGCKTGSGKLTATTTRKVQPFEIRVRGVGAEAPVVEVRITFPAVKPSVTITDARFDGTAFPDTNGIAALVWPRAAGNVRVVAEWGGHPFTYEVDAFEQGGPGSQSLVNQGPSTGTDSSLAVTTGNPWKILLQNIEGGFGVTPMTVTISWP